MDKLTKKRQRLEKRKRRVFHSIKPKSKRYRLVLVRSNRYLSAQIINDTTSQTLCSASTVEKSFSGNTKNKEAASKLGNILASRAKEKKLEKVYFDRRGRLYHGCLVAFAETARKEGMVF